MRRRVFVVLLTVLILLTAFSFGQAQGEIPVIAYGDSVRGEAVDIETPIWFIFEGRAGDAITIEATSSTVDTYVALVDITGSLLAENDDISSDNLNARIEFVLPADGQYGIAVLGYTSGPFTLTLSRSGSGTPSTPAGQETVTQAFSGEITGESIWLDIPVTLKEGDTIVVTAAATSGDLDTYVYLTDTDYNIFAENDDQDNTTTNSRLEYTVQQAGDYLVSITRFGLDDGQTSGTVDVTIQISAGTITNVVTTSTTGSALPNPSASGYPDMQPQPEAEWTILAYYGGDNNLEDGLIVDLDEYEVGGGSDGKVNIVLLMDRSPEYDTSNGDTTGVYVYEIGPDVSDDYMTVYPPTIDTQPLVDLGELDTSSGDTLAAFLVWGIRTFPAKRYVIQMNDHGGGWTGLVTDDTDSTKAITLPELERAFKIALDVAGVEKFDLLVNDACLMSNVEYYTLIAPYFKYALGAPEIMNNPGYDMSVLTAGLKQGFEPVDIGPFLIDRYLQTFEGSEVYGGQTPNMTDLTKFPAVTDAVENFASVFNSNPDAYASVVGQARANTYNYGEQAFVLQDHIDLGDFMYQITRRSNDPNLTAAAQNVINALNDVLVYGQKGNQVARNAKWYSIYFPSRADEYIVDAYQQQTTLTIWQSMLNNYFRSLTPSSRRSAAPFASRTATAAPSVPPQVSITNVYPTETSTAFPTWVSMEVVGRNIAKSTFIVDQVQPDGSLVRLDSADIVTFAEVEEDVFENINYPWASGVNDFRFFWQATLTQITDGTTSALELVEVHDETTLKGRYRNAGDANWIEVTLYFNDEGRATRAMGSSIGSTALGEVTLRAGAEFQAYRAIVTPDGRIKYEPGTLYTWPEGGLALSTVPAPSGQYRLGFNVEVFGGGLGFNSAAVTVNNDNIDPAYLGYTELDLGFNLLYPADWSSFEYFNQRAFYSSNNADATQYLYVYPVYDATDAQSAAQSVLDGYAMSLVGGFTPITVNGRNALEFSFTTAVEDRAFTGKAFAVYDEALQAGLVFSAEVTEGTDNTALYQLLLDNVTFFDAQAVKDQDTGLWGSDFYADSSYPVLESWLPGSENDFGWVYTFDSATFAAISAFQPTEADASTFLNQMLDQFVAGKSGYTLDNIQTYYGENNTWEVAYFSHSDGGEFAGRMYVTIKNNTPYVMWFEAPADRAVELFRNVFEVMADGFVISESTSTG